LSRDSKAIVAWFLVNDFSNIPTAATLMPMNALIAIRQSSERRRCLFKANLRLQRRACEVLSILARW
jgi:hypothetical protein